MNQGYFFLIFLTKSFLSSPELVDPLKVEVFIVPISYHVSGYTLSVFKVASEYFPSTAFLFSQSKLKNKGIVIFSEIYGQVILALWLLGFCLPSILRHETVLVLLRPVADPQYEY